MPDPPRSSQRWILALVLLSYLTTALFASHYGYEVFHWDDSEYVAEALDTADHVTSFGVPSWLSFIAFNQHYAKPPLYVNSLALFIHLVGRSRAPMAVGLLGALTSALLGIGVFRLIQPLTSFWFGVLAMLAITGLPAVARWAPTAYPDMQLALCVVWVIAILSTEARARWLGVALGAGMLAKLSFPLFVAGPILYWLWQGKQDRAARARLLLRAGLIGAALAVVWYWPNFSEALGHAKDSYAYSDQQNPVFLGALTEWLKVSAVDGIGCIMLTLACIAPLVLVAGRRGAAPSFPAEQVRMLLAGALPAFLITLSSPLPDNRRLLPSYVLFTLAFLLVIFWVAKTSRLRGIVLTLLIAVVMGQWAIAQLAQIPWTAERLQASPLGPRLALLGPAIMELQPASTEAVGEVINRVMALGSAAPPRWYVAGRDGYFNVPRLQLAAKVRRIPVEFDWAEYYTWTEDQVVSQMKSIANSSAILLVAHPAIDSNLAKYFARNVWIVQQHLGEFHSFGEGSYVSLYATKSAYEALPPEPVLADYSGRIQLFRAEVSGRTLSLRLKLLTPFSCRYKLMVHAFGADGVWHAWDQSIDPPLCKWQPGDIRLMTFELPEAYVQSPYRLEIGFFDEADSVHGYPPLKVAGGRNSFCVPPPMATGNVLCPVGYIDFSRRP